MFQATIKLATVTDPQGQPRLVSVPLRPDGNIRAQHGAVTVEDYYTGAAFTVPLTEVQA